MRCRNCGHVNPDENNYCGKCGKLLLPAFSEIREAVLARRPAAAEATPRPEPVASVASKETRQEYALAEEAEFAAEAPKRAPVAPSPSLGGPSFLGLNGPTEDGSFTYLLEDEEPRSHTGRRVLLLLLAVAVGVAAWQWRSVSDFVIVTVMPYLQGTITSAAKAPPTTSPEATTPAPDAAQPTSAEIAEAPQAAPASAGAAPDASSKDSNGSAQPASANQSANQDQPNQAGAAKQSAQAEQNPQDKQAEADTSETPAKPTRTARKTQTPAPAKSASPAKEKEAEPAAAPAEDRESQNLLAAGERYLYGRGAPRDCQRALIYMQAAAQKDNAGALSHLGAMYSTGECVPLDRTRAYGFFSRALQLDRSNTYLERNLTILWREMSDAERQNVLRTRRQ